MRRLSTPFATPFATALECVALIALVTTACGDGSPPGSSDAAHDAAGSTDAATADAPPPPPDASPPDAAPPLSPHGQPCPTGTECTAMDSFCLDEGESWPGEGYCTAGCANDADCGAGAFCTPDLGGGTRLCFADCAYCTGPGVVCSTTVGGFIDLGEPACIPGEPTATDGVACTAFYDCNSEQGCITNPFSLPGGMCITFGCTVGDDSTCAPGGDGLCIPQGAGSLCLDQCTIASDCREAEGYGCLMVAAGVNICFGVNAGPGAPCGAASECGLAPWECLTGTGFPGGYCGADSCDPTNDQTCPFDSICYDATPGTLDGSEFCAATCASMMDCRMGYQCLEATPGGETVCR